MTLKMCSGSDTGYLLNGLNKTHSFYDVEMAQTSSNATSMIRSAIELGHDKKGLDVVVAHCELYEMILLLVLT